MKEKHYVLVNKQGDYLAKYENIPATFGVSASWSDDITDALSVPFEADKINTLDKFEAFEKMFDGEVVIADIDVKLTRLDGTPFTAEPQESDEVEDALTEVIRSLIRQAGE